VAVGDQEVGTRGARSLRAREAHTQSVAIGRGQRRLASSSC
jgi:hypothetical protein